MGQRGNFSFKPPQAFSRRQEYSFGKGAGRWGRKASQSLSELPVTLVINPVCARQDSQSHPCVHTFHLPSISGWGRDYHQHSYSPKEATEDWSDWVSPVCGAQPRCEHHSYSRPQSPALLITSPPPVRDCSTAWGDVWIQLEIKLFLVFFSTFILLIYQFTFIYAWWGRDTGVMAGSKPYGGCWKSNVGPLQGQRALPAALQPFSLIFIMSASLEYTYKIIINMYCFPIN